MAKQLLLFLSTLIRVTFCYSQETGCFSLTPNQSVDLKTNIDFNRYDLIFVGEFHGVSGVPGIKLALIKYANAQCGINDVFMEISYSSAWLYNRYLATGDTSFFSTPALVYAMNQTNRTFWKNLYDYNKTAAHKITIHGMDFERLEFLKVLKLLMPKGKEKPAGIRQMLSYIDTVTITDVNKGKWEQQQRGNITKLYDSIRRQIRNEYDSYGDYYGANFRMVEKIMFNENTFSNYSERDKTMYQNIMKEIKEQSIRKLITLNGLKHCNKSSQGSQSLYYRLSKSRSFRKKTVSIAMACKNCYDLQQKPDHRKAAYLAPYSYRDSSLVMENIFERHFNPHCTYTLLPTEVTGESKVAEYSDYLILMKDQPEY